MKNIPTFESFVNESRINEASDTPFKKSKVVSKSPKAKFVAGDTVKVNKSVEAYEYDEAYRGGSWIDGSTCPDGEYDCIGFTADGDFVILEGDNKWCIDLDSYGSAITKA